MTTTVMPSFRLMSLIRVRMEWVVLGSSALVASSQSRTSVSYTHLTLPTKRIV